MDSAIGAGTFPGVAESALSGIQFVAFGGCTMPGESRQRIALLSNRGTAKIRSQNFRGPRRRKFFRVLAKHAYPKQTAYEVRRLTKERYGERTIYDWIAGRSEAPMSVCIRIMGEILAD